MAIASMAHPPTTKLAPAPTVSGRYNGAQTSYEDAYRAVQAERMVCPECRGECNFGSGDDLDNCQSCEGNGWILSSDHFIAYEPMAEAEEGEPAEDWTEAAGAEFAGVIGL